MSESFLSIQNVRKAFEGIYALSGIDLSISKGECIALVGENGAGKSTLMKILSGVWPYGSYEGTIRFCGKPLRLASPLEGRRAGISIIHQELCLFPKLSVAENLFLTEKYPFRGHPSDALFCTIPWGGLWSRARGLLDELGFQIDVHMPVENLSVAERQLVEIARAIHQSASLLILDEPTSALSQAEIRTLFRVIERMREQVTVVYISHKLDEVLQLCDRAVVLRDGKKVADLNTKEVTQTQLVSLMVGRPFKPSQVRHSNFPHENGPVVLEVESLGHEGLDGKALLDGICFNLFRGEVLGIAGLMGSGRSELLRSLLGVLPGHRRGDLFYEGRNVRWQGLEHAIHDGVFFVPEDRKKDGLFLDLGIDFNISIAILNQLRNRWGTLDLSKEHQSIKSWASRMKVGCYDYSSPLRILSGGNQQKVLLAKAVATQPKVLLLDEPTRGIDVGAKEEIYEIIQKFSERGISTILVSSDLPELLSLSDRILVMREGRQRGILVNDGLTQEAVMAFAAGGESNG